MPKLNCWETMQCGREPGGKNMNLGICPVTTEYRLNGAHGGKHGGRACWIIAGTLCGGIVQGTFAQKYKNCEKCRFYQTVRAEEGSSFKLSLVLMQKLNSQTDLLKQTAALTVSNTAALRR